MRRRFTAKKEKKLFIKRFFPAGTYTWVVPNGCTEVDVFLVGAGGGAGSYTPNWGLDGGGGGGYTKTFRGKGYVKPSSGTWIGSETEGRDGDAIAVTSGQQIEIIVGAGIAGKDGGFSQFMNSKYRADGGKCSNTYRYGGDGGSPGGSWDFGNGYKQINGGSDGKGGANVGQGHTTRDFGEPAGKRNAAGGAVSYIPSHYNSLLKNPSYAGESDYNEGLPDKPNISEFRINEGDEFVWVIPKTIAGGYGGGANSANPNYKLKGGDGTVLIRYYAYEE